MLSPVLIFTTDEVWAFIPGNEAGDSVHLHTWPDLPISIGAEEKSVWGLLFELRENVLSVLEELRRAGTMGKALEAAVKIRLLAQFSLLQSHAEELREILNVSQLHLENARRRSGNNRGKSKSGLSEMRTLVALGKGCWSLYRVSNPLRALYGSSEVGVELCLQRFLLPGRLRR